MKKIIKYIIKTILILIRNIFKILPISNDNKKNIKIKLVMYIIKLKSFIDPDNIIYNFIKTKELSEKEILLLSNYNDYINGLFDIGKKSNDFVEYKKNNISITEEDIKLITYYLPQFHTFPENDEWWGKGFTEWTNVTKAIPHFVGHYQPHLPYDNTFYDLSNLDVMRKQVELAKNYGIYGFCIHYYWFNGKRLLEKPLDNFLNSDIDFKFCINWANENWTRKWDGAEQEVLLAQKHSDEDDLACIVEICKYVRDERYIRINGKPLIIIYNSAILPDVNNTIKIWRKYCRENGIGEICITGAKTFPTEDPLIYDFDEAVEFPPHFLWRELPCISSKKTSIHSSFAMNIYDMSDYINQKQYFNNKPERIYRCVFPNWDNTPRRGNEGFLFQLDLSQYKNWLSDIMKHTKENRKQGDRLVFINSWNEWAEGAHLEPDRRYGYAYLQATAEILMENNEY